MPLDQVAAPPQLTPEEQLKLMKQLEEKMKEQNKQREEAEKLLQKQREEMEKNRPHLQNPTQASYTEFTTGEPTPTPTCAPCRNRSMMILLAIVLLVAIIYLIFNGDKVFEKSK
jgi:predicted RND superfamily exporter protein